MIEAGKYSILSRVFEMFFVCTHCTSLNICLFVYVLESTFIIYIITDNKYSLLMDTKLMSSGQ